MPAMNGFPTIKLLRIVLSPAARALVAVALLALLFRKTDPDAIYRTLASVSWPLVAAGFVTILATVFASALRWYCALHALHHRIGLIYVVELSFAGLFLAQFFPAGVGGDIYRAYMVNRKGVSLRDGVISVAIDRGVGLVILALLVCTDLPALTDLESGYFVLVTTGLCLALMVAIALFTVAERWVPASLQRGRLAGLLSAIVTHRRTLSRRWMVGTVASSCLIYVGWVSSAYLFALSLAPSAQWFQCLVVVPVALLAAMLPLSINGWGVREWVMITGFAVYGVPPEQALLISTLLGVSAMLGSVPGSLFLAMEKLDHVRL